MKESETQLEYLYNQIVSKQVSNIDRETMVRTIAGKLRSLANEGPGALERTIEATLTNIERQSNHVQLSVTGLGWLGSRTMAVEENVAQLIQNAQREILICTYLITSSAMPVIDKLSTSMAGGVVSKIVVNDFHQLAKPVQDALFKLLKSYPQLFSLYSFKNPDSSAVLHAKVIVSDRLHALVGSANLTYPALMTNHEMALRVTGPVAEDIAGRIDSLCGSKSVSKIVV